MVVHDPDCADAGEASSAAATAATRHATATAPALAAIMLLCCWVLASLTREQRRQMPLELVDLVVRTADCLVADIYGLVFSGFVLMRFL